jgi:hypothetical protein
MHFKISHKETHSGYMVVSLSNDMDPERVSLYDPPPAYEEAIDTILYPPTPQMNRVI